MLSAENRPAAEARATLPRRPVEITRAATFSAGHMLRRPDWSQERNLTVYGACATDHGHNYRLEVTVVGLPDPQTGMVINLKILDELIRRLVVSQVDHRHLNRDVDFLTGVVPTVENLALAFWKRLEEQLEGVTLERLRLVETDNNSAEVRR
jgi:6-pyruvoyltetrahydropterin/6-carboxytetrahydropterin synthase